MNLDVKINSDMIITIKQLLMFAVQISYGLEYLSQKGFVHRDVAARNILVHEKKNAKIGDFGLCRYIYRDSSNYKGRGGRLPVKWMSPEAIKHYEFTTQSDVLVLLSGAFVLTYVQKKFFKLQVVLPNIMFLFF
ncbi:unnamed protein product [Gongylonema pulchrum]|uniref:Protein kinase domain-containing protein n=1 Tax=Gongylonema pulchrum TaxID=637853 RepID=A0A3P6SSG3_9BILA|nr:unnamed protein product [Gongylonema pulchrum]